MPILFPDDAFKRLLMAQNAVRLAEARLTADADIEVILDPLIRAVRLLVDVVVQEQRH